MGGRVVVDLGPDGHYRCSMVRRSNEHTLETWEMLHAVHSIGSFLSGRKLGKIWLRTYSLKEDFAQ